MYEANFAACLVKISKHLLWALKFIRLEISILKTIFIYPPTFMKVRQKILYITSFQFFWFSSFFHYLRSTTEKISPNNYTYTIEQTGPPRYIYIFHVLSYSVGYIHYNRVQSGEGPLIATYAHCKPRLHCR